MGDRIKVTLGPLLQSPNFREAVSKIHDRAEKQLSAKSLLSSYVDTGMLTNLANSRNQLIFGRRGTGKTHILRVLSERLSEDRENVVVFLDMRVLGSSSQFLDQTLQLGQRCYHLFKDILLEVHKGLQDYYVNLNPRAAGAALDELRLLERVITEPLRRYTAETLSSRRLSKSAEQDALHLSLGAEGLAGGYKGGTDAALEDETNVSYRVASEDKFLFTDLNDSLKRVLESSGTSLYLLLDEWSSLPLDLQPYFAEFLKRGLFTNPRVCVKIGSVEFRSNFSLDRGGGVLGFERGGDISTGLNIDEHYLFNLREERVVGAFAEMLYRHLRAILMREEALEETRPEPGEQHRLVPRKLDYLSQGLQVESALGLVNNLFEDWASFRELVRASEGVARDFIQLFNEAFVYTTNRSLSNISRVVVFDAALGWFEREKKSNLDERLRAALLKIVEQMTPGRGSRSFLVPQNAESNPILQRLYDLRILHKTHKGYTRRARPREVYSVYTLDYGCYAELFYTYLRPKLRYSVYEEKVQQQRLHLDLHGRDLFAVPQDNLDEIEGLIFDRKFFAQFADRKPRAATRKKGPAAQTGGPQSGDAGAG